MTRNTNLTPLSAMAPIEQGKQKIQTIQASVINMNQEGPPTLLTSNQNQDNSHIKSKGRRASRQKVGSPGSNREIHVSMPPRRQKTLLTRLSSPFIASPSPFREKEQAGDLGESSIEKSIGVFEASNTKENSSQVTLIKYSLDEVNGKQASREGGQISNMSRYSKKFKSLSPVNVDNVDGVGKTVTTAAAAPTDLNYMIIGEKKTLQSKKQPTPLALRSRNMQKIR